MYIPSCAYNGTVSPFSVSNKKWVAKGACVDGETELILLPDFGDGTVVKDTCGLFLEGDEVALLMRDRFSRSTWSGAVDFSCPAGDLS